MKILQVKIIITHINDTGKDKKYEKWDINTEKAQHKGDAENSSNRGGEDSYNMHNLLGE